MQAKKAKGRKRGVRASRAKLSQALIDAGFQTQHQLAERIAEIEALESVPKDLVNRVFREHRVEPRSLERIARALGIEAYSIYMTRANDSPDVYKSSSPAGISQDRIASARSTIDHGRFQRSALMVVGIVALAFVLGVFWRLSSDVSLRCSAREFVRPLHATEGRLGIVIARFANDPDNLGQHLLAMSFIDDARLDPYMSILQTCQVLSLDSPGDVRLRRRALRARGQRLLQKADALVLLWGRVQGDHLEVRLVSTRTANHSLSSETGNNNGAIKEAYFQIPVPLAGPSSAISALKSRVLRLMDPEKKSKIKLQAEAAAYDAGNRRLVDNSSLGQKKDHRQVVGGSPDSADH